MPTNKDFKRKVRARMSRTGESYTAARAQLERRGGRPTNTADGAEAAPAVAADAGTTAVDVPDTRDPASVAGTADATVVSRTGRDWAGWVAVLDAVEAHTWPHRDIARHLRDEHAIGSWWAQQLTGGYERIKGLRRTNQRRDGSFDVNKSKTLPVSISRLYRAFGARERRRWADGAGWTVRTSRVDKSMRLTWEDGTPVDVYFWEKGPQKSQVQLQHRKLPDARRAAELRERWTGLLASLAEHLG